MSYDSMWYRLCTTNLLDKGQGTREEDCIYLRRSVLMLYTLCVMFHITFIYQQSVQLFVSLLASDIA